MKDNKCVGCGYCCLKTPCDAARRLYPNATECPQLIWTGKRYECGLMKLPGLIGEGYRKELYAGEGCCCGLNSWRRDIKHRVPEMDRSSLNPLPKLLQMFIAALSKQFLSTDSIFLTILDFQAQLEKENYSPDEIKSIIKNISYLFDNSRSSMTKGFMG